MSTNDSNAALAELAAVKGRLDTIIQLIQSNHAATHQRIDDLRHQIDGRFSGHDARIERLESNERSTAIKAATAGTLGGTLGSALVQGVIEAIKHAGR